MDAYQNQQGTAAPPRREPAPEIAPWLSVSGDLDDFIYYGEEARVSER